MIWWSTYHQICDYVSWTLRLPPNGELNQIIHPFTHLSLSPPPLPQSLSGSLHNVAEDFSSSSMSSTSFRSLSSSSCSSSHPDLSSSSLVLNSESSSSSCSPQTPQPVYNKQVADSCIIRVSVESVSNGNIYKSILVSAIVIETTAWLFLCMSATYFGV